MSSWAPTGCRPRKRLYRPSPRISSAKPQTMCALPLEMNENENWALRIFPMSP